MLADKLLQLISMCD